MTSQKTVYKVVKKQLGIEGRIFSHRAHKFASETEAREYAASFAAEQRRAGVSGTKIVVFAGDRAIVTHNVGYGTGARRNLDIVHDRAGA